VMHVAQGDLLEASLAGRGADVHFHHPRRVGRPTTPSKRAGRSSVL